MTTTTDGALETGAERMARERLEDRIRYAVGQLKQGKYLSITNGPDGEVAGTCGHDPRVGRDWLLHMVERRAAR
ncbi:MULTISPECIES: hypothetical protein [Streptomyces]|uniref:Uncharacterized protein n=1 Tax=Streptomyces muensis TaxID=1077944 RepID=A0A9X1TIY8_STRM4|nr:MULTISPECIES: hypothetical protein [Streptomyces]MCF1592465.1 hypothetical protein [Streptomyces muensis]QKV98149.1 hypothetical protein HUT19_41240 [Streptomyces sp. NA02950]